MFEITINDQTVLVPKGSTVLEACRFVGIDIPRFCYHDRLSVAGNCRMCLVEIEKTPKPIASCAMPVANQMVVYTETPLVKKARENVLETLLLNHPLDCPICDQGGECDLQDQTRVYGSDYTRFYIVKRTVEDKYCGPLIKTIMTRCIHCTRCVRYAAEIAGVDILGTLNRGGHTEIGTYFSRIFQTEIAGNVIDLCPVGALTSKPYAFTARPWELRTAESIDVLDSLASNIFIDFKETEALRILPRLNEDVNEEWISDRIRFSYDALRRQRISDIYLRSNNQFIQKDWSDCLSILKNHISNSNVLILVSSSIDINSLNLLKSLANQSNIRLVSIDSNLSRSYNTIWNHNSSATILDLEKSDICFLLGVNPRYEGAVLNIRIRAQYLKGNYSIVHFGTPYKANISTNFLGISLTELFNLFEGRSSLLSIISSAKQPYFILGDALLKRIDLNLLFTHFGLLNSNSKILPLSAKINIQNHIFQNIRKFQMQDLIWSDSIISLYLDDNQIIRQILSNSQSKFKIWGHCNGSVSASLNDLILPLSSFVEDENQYLNAESRFVKSTRIFSSIKSIRSVSLILKALFNSQSQSSILSESHFSSNLFFSNPFAFLGNNDLFSHFISSKKFFTTNFNSKLLNVDLCTLLPLKSTIEDFYLVDTFTRSSQIMGQCSSIFRKRAINFLKF